MHLVIHKDDLSRAITAAGRVVESRNIIPILSNLKIEAEGDSLAITATDLTIVASVKAAATVTASGAVCVEAKLIGEIAKKAVGDITMMLDGDHLIVKSGRSRFSLKTLDTRDFPTLDAGDYAVDFAADLGGLMANVSFAIGHDSSREMLNGVFVHTKAGKLVAVATDGHRLARVVGDDAPEFEGVIVPEKAVGVIPKGLAQVSISEEKLRVVGEDITITTKLIGLQYPAYERVIPQANELAVIVDRDAMMRAADRVVTVSSEKAKGVRLSIASGAVALSARSDLGTAEDEVEADYAGEPIEYGLNSTYLRDMLSALPPGRVTLKLNANFGPANVTGENDNWDGVLMPLRVN
ncbi:MAG: DNA polymerase III subunit beta [Rhizobium sp.]|nr:DNA polymerase III subunit beta [Rhizobium sp.]